MYICFSFLCLLADHMVMELTETNVQIRNCPIDFIPVYIKQESNEHEADFNDVEIISAAQHLCAIEIKENKGANANDESKRLLREAKESIHNLINTNTLDSTLNTVEESDTCINAVLSSSMYLQNIDSENINLEVEKPTNQVTEVFFSHNEPIQMTNYNISTVTIPSELLGLNLNIKKEDDTNQGTVYTTEWLCSSNDETELQLKISKNNTHPVALATQIDTSNASTETTEIQAAGQEGQAIEGSGHPANNESEPLEKAKRRVKLRATALQDYTEKLRKKAECMREKRKKLYEQESEEQRQQRLAKEAAKRREMRLYYETPEQRRKRLDAEAARKREYRMYNETPEDRRKRLDREAERRRIKRLSLYASETPEQRRERLNRESAKRREARINQYAKETQEERKERLRKDALRVREMRFTRSAIETEEERRQRLVKDSLRKREVRMHGTHSANNNFTELQTVRNFDELNSVQIKDNTDSKLGGHYLSNWMVWFQNTLAQPVHLGEQVVKSQAQNSE